MNKDNALKLALSVLNEVRSETFRLLRNGQKLYAEEKVWNAIYVIREALMSVPDGADSALDRMAENARELGLDYEPDVVLPGGGHVPAVPVAVYGYCPECGGAGVMRERRPNGDDKCTNGHKYPSSKALAEPPCKTGSQCTSKCQQCEQSAQQSHCNDCGGFDPECPLAQPTQGCEFCSHPLYVGTKCKNCGRERPAQQQEPVALETVYETIIHWDEGGGKRSRRELARRIVALYTSPPASKPLTDEVLQKHWPKVWPVQGAFVRASADDLREFAHGIKGEQHV